MFCNRCMLSLFRLLFENILCNRFIQKDLCMEMQFDVQIFIDFIHDTIRGQMKRNVLPSANNPSKNWKQLWLGKYPILFRLGVYWEKCSQIQYACVVIKHKSYWKTIFWPTQFFWNSTWEQDNFIFVAKYRKMQGFYFQLRVQFFFKWGRGVKGKKGCWVKGQWCWSGSQLGLQTGPLCKTSLSKIWP